MSRAIVLLGMLFATIAGAMGGYQLGRGSGDELRAQMGQTNRDARICWETLYAVNKLRGNPGMCEQKPAAPESGALEE